MDVSTGHGTYDIKSGGRPSGNPANYNYSLIQTLLSATNPGKVTSAGNAFNSAAQAAAQVAHELYQVGTRLSGMWEGADADAAQKALGQLYATANELFGRSQQAGHALQNYGAALPQYKGLQWPPDGASPVEDQARQKVAEQVMRAVNGHIGSAWDAMPDKVQQNLPDLKGGVDERPYSPGGNPTVHSGGSGGLSGVGGSSERARLPHLPHGGGESRLAGMPPVGGGLGTVPPPTSNPFGLAVPGGSPSFPGGGVGTPSPFPGAIFGPGESPLGRPGPGSPSGLAPENPATNSAMAAEEIEASQAARGGLIGTPTGAAEKEMERETNAWLVEERRTWGAEEEAVPRMVGTSPVVDAADELENDRERRTWLDEERQVWTGEESHTPETIGDAKPRFDEAKPGEEEPDEPGVLDLERLQELLDSVVEPAGKADATEPDIVDEFASLLDDLDLGEANDIDRLLNG